MFLNWRNVESHRSKKFNKLHTEYTHDAHTHTHILMHIPRCTIRKLLKINDKQKILKVGRGKKGYYVKEMKLRIATDLLSETLHTRMQFNGIF